MMFKPGALRLLPPLLASLWLAACATPEPAKVTEPNNYDMAETAEFRGQYERAADLWLQLANQSPPSAAAAFRLRAAEAWNASGQTQYAYELLTDIRPDTLSTSERSRFYLLRTEKALSEADLRAAQADLDLAGDSLDPALEPRFLALQQTIHQRRAGTNQYRLLSAISSNLGPSGAFSLAQALDLLSTYEYVPSGSLLEAAAMPSLSSISLVFSRLMIASELWLAPLRSSRGLSPKKKMPWSGLEPLKPDPLMIEALATSSSSLSTLAICMPSCLVSTREAPFWSWKMPRP